MVNEVATNGIHREIADHYEAMNGALYERDRLTDDCRQLSNSLAVAHQLNDEHQKQIIKLQAERDYYYRKAYAFENKLRDMKGMIDGVMSLVEFEAENSPVTAPKMPMVSNIGGEKAMTEGELAEGLKKDGCP